MIINAYLYYAELAASLGWPDQAISVLTRAIELERENLGESYSRLALLYNTRGNVHHSQQNYIDAKSDHTRAIRYDIDQPVSYILRAQIYYCLHEFSKSAQDITRAIRRIPIGPNPMYSGLYNNRGIAYYLMGELDKAIKDFTTSIVLDPNDSVSYLNRGVAYFYQGNNKNAFADFEKALSFYPPDVLIHNTPDNLLGMRNMLLSMRQQQQEKTKPVRSSLTTNGIFNQNAQIRYYQQRKERQALRTTNGRGR
jgi:tetratricopeptide (TPR) repeat protein